MIQRLSLLIPLVVLLASLWAGTAYAASNAPNCVLTVDHGLSSTQIDLDRCAKAYVAAGGTDLSQFRVVYTDRFWFATSYQPLTPQAQQAVKDALQGYLVELQQDYQYCLNQNATISITGSDSWTTLFRGWGDPSTWVMDHLSTTQFASGC